MTALSAAPARRRGAFVALPALIAALLAPLAFAAPASAATVDGLVTGFQIDGNKTAAAVTPVQSTFDWGNFLSVPAADGAYTFTPTGPYTTADGFSSTGIVDASFYWDNGTLAEACDGSDPASAFPGSVKPKDNPWVQGPSNVNAKSDGCSSGGAYEVITDDEGVDHYVFYQYWTRLSGNGDMSLYQLLEGADPGRCDDILVEFNYNSPTNKLGAQTQVNILQWTPTVAAPAGCDPADPGTWTTLQANFPHDAVVGVRTEGPALPGEPETFGEIAIDLTFGNLFDEDGCTSFEGGGYVTRTGNSSTAELIDAVGPGSSPLTISNCGAIEITKASDPEDLASEADFGYELVRSDTGVVSDDTLLGLDDQDAELTNTYTGTADHGIAGSLGIGDTHTWGPIFAGDYDLTETIDGADPFELQSIVCTVTDPGTGQAVVVTVVDDGEDLDEDIPVFVGETTACVITNAADPASLELEKTVTGVDDGVVWSFDVTISPDPQSGSATQTVSGTGAGTDNVTWDDLLPGETYTVAETAVDGWTEGEITCEVDGGELDDASTDDGFQFVAAPGLALECALTNTADPGQIVVTKTAVGGDGVFEFELTPLDDPEADPLSQSATTVGGTGTATFSGILPGSRFAIAEVGPGTSWTAGELTCEVTPAGSTESAEIDVDDFTVDPGDAIACAITNTAKGTITVVKNVTGADDTFSFTGSWLTPEDDFTITTDSGTETKTFDDILAGSYTLAEVLGDGYDGVGLSCVETDTNDSSVSVPTLTASLVLQPGETITCTYTNSEWGVLVVDKVTVPGSSQQDFQFEWTPAGDPDSDTDFALANATDAYSSGALAPGDYVVSEIGEVKGWVLTGLVCTDTAGDDTEPVVTGQSATVHVGLGETVTCTFTNAQRGPLTFDKVVAPGSPVNNGDGTWTIEYDLTVTSGSNIPEDYDLEDELDFGAGILPTAAGVTSNNGVTVNAGWDGVGDIVVATGATIPALGSHTYTVTVTAEVEAELDPDAADCQVADGEGSGFLNAGSIEFWSGTDTDDACAALPISDLEITKDAPFSVDFEPAVGPTEFDYEVFVENLGPDTAYDVVLEDPLPADLDFVSATGTDAVCGFAAGVVTCELGDLAVGETRTVTITVSIPVDYPIDEEAVSFRIDNVATTSTITPESDLTNNEDDAETTVLVTLPLPPEDPEDPELPTLALTGAAIGVATQLALSLLAVGLAFTAMSLRRRASGRHAV